MVGKRIVTCAKCGITSKEEPNIMFHRFPLQVSLKAKVWAKFCFPNKDWSTDQSLEKLYKENKVICGKHFDDSSYTNSDRIRLNKFAIPTEAREILAQLRDELRDHPTDKPETQFDPEVPSTSQYSRTIEHLNEYNPRSSKLTKIDPEDPSTASTSQCSISIEHLNQCNPQSSTLTEKPCRRKSLLKEIGVKSLAEMTPKKRKLYLRCRKNVTEILRLRRKFRKVKKCKRNILDSLQSDSAVNDMLKCKLSSSFYLLLQSQLQNNQRKLTGRRWTLDDKVLALSIYKKSSSCYRLLRRLFCLPSPSSLKALLNEIPFVCGINKQVIHTIKEITEKRNVEDNLCILAFDEMSIRKNLSYNSKLDQMDGYQDHAGQGRTADIASKALTFMAVGIRKNWKQPIAFYFSGAHVTADRLPVLIKEVLHACFEAGLEVIGVVCDCDGVNLRSLNSLGSSTDRPYFEFERHEIVTILDPPHLLKCFRNNFMAHDIQFNLNIQIDGQQSTGVAKWSHIEQLYNTEKSNANFVFAPALTQQHLQPNGKQKMKVKLAAQVLSHSVASGLYAKVGQNELPQAATATAEVVANMDQLFDAVNGNTPDRKRGKPLLTNMSSTSLHLECFSKMKNFFKDMTFLGARTKPPSQEGWLRTLNAIERIFNNVKRYNIHTLAPRRLNQDPLENCFGCIRNNCGSNPNPTSVQFVAALKTSIITNLINNNNKNRNCLDDNNELLNNFKVFLSKGEHASLPEGGQVEEEEIDVQAVQMNDIPQCSGEMQACAYVCGFILKNMKLNCQQCRQIFLSDPNTEVCHLFTSFREYDNNQTSLNYVQTSFCTLVENAATNVNEFLKNCSHTDKIKTKLRKICDTLNFTCMKGCLEHFDNNKKEIINCIIAICLKRFCTLKNRGFAEQYSNQTLARKIKILKNV